jgi:LCP family protein required for cell wall assembly
LPWVAGGAALLAGAGLTGFLLLGGRPPEAPTESPTPTVEPTPAFNEELLNSRLTVLLLGLDTNEPRRARGAGLNSDSIMVASVNADQSEVTLISVPRDTVDVPLPDGTLWQQKINAIFAIDGPEAMVSAVASLLDVPIDGYVTIDMGDFILLVDEVDGVRVNPKAPLVDDHLDLDLPAGRQVLEGETALSYVRSRFTDSDYARAARQQEVLPRLAFKLVDPDADIDITSLLDQLFSFETDLPLEELPTLIEIARRAQDAKVTRQVLSPQDGFVLQAGDLGDGRGYVIVPDIDAIRAFVADHLRD